MFVNEKLLYKKLCINGKNKSKSYFTTRTFGILPKNMKKLCRFERRIKELVRRFTRFGLQQWSLSGSGLNLPWFTPFRRLSVNEVLLRDQVWSCPEFAPFHTLRVNEVYFWIRLESVLIRSILQLTPSDQCILCK